MDPNCFVRFTDAAAAMTRRRMATESNFVGRFDGANNQNADCHFSNCFFDALFLNGEATGGLFLVEDCFEVHLRGSLIRVQYGPNASRESIAAVKTNEVSLGWTHVSLEGTTLTGAGESILHIGRGTVCWYIARVFFRACAGPGAPALVG
jgi:hypothetical protein